VNIRRAASLVLGVVLVVWLVQVGSVSALPASSARSTRHASTPVRSPSLPPLALGEAQSEEASASAPSSGGDTLVENGLGSPLCRSAENLSAAEQRNCQTADFVAAPDPTNDYAFDVNINTGVSKWGNDIAAMAENFAQFGWMALVSATHSLVVMFEWCYSLNLLSDSLLREMTVALHDARLTFTEPWMVIALAVASTLAVYHGLIRRRVTDTIGGALAMLAMMVGGLWVIADPAGTVGAVEQWANQVGLGTLAVVASGSPSHPERTLAESMQVLFSSVVSTPWCYMEFGDVGWCENSGQLDGGLRTAGLAIAGSEEKKSGCHDLCDAGASPGDQTLAASAMLLREAQTNGELFLALPANEPERNSVKNKGTLLGVLCGGGESADKCRGPTAPQAEFRSEKAAESRVLGLFLIWIGALGMLLLLGCLALRLLYAALLGLFFLLLAPAAVLAPALGEGGRSVFRSWALKLMEAVVAKLTYSFLLGVVLMMMKVLLGLTVLGWLTQWLLISAFWWGVFIRRDQVLGFAPGGGPSRLPGGPRSIARRVSQALETPRALLRLGSTIKDKFARPAPEVKPSPMYSSTAHTTVQTPLVKEAPDGGLSQSGVPPASGEGGDRRHGAGDADSPGAHNGYALVDRFGPPGEDRADGGPSRGSEPSGRPGTEESGRRGGNRGAGSGSTSGGGGGSAHGQTRERGGDGAGRSRKQSSGDRLPGHELGGGRHEHGHRADVRTIAEAMGTGGGTGQSGGLAQGGAPGQSRQLERVRRERQKALAEGDAQRAAKLGAREQRVEAKLARHQALALEMADPELGVSELMADATAIRHIGGSGSRGGGAASGDSPGSAATGPPLSTKRRSSVMDDARDVAARRKRQLGWEAEG
jgi:hypothetical protein